jgi:hypothetical protein
MRGAMPPLPNTPSWDSFTFTLSFTRSFQRIRPSPRNCVIFNKKVFFYGEDLFAPRPTPKLENHPCQPPTTASIHSQLPSVSRGRLHHLQPEDAPYRGDRNPRLTWYSYNTQIFIHSAFCRWRFQCYRLPEKCGCPKEAHKLNNFPLDY